MNFKEIFEEAETALDNQDPYYGLNVMSELFREPGQLKDEATMLQVITMLGRLFAVMNKQQLVDDCGEATADLNNSDKLYQLGYDLVQQGYPAVSAIILSYANVLAPQNETILTELIAALEMQGLYEQARSILAQANTQNFLPAYLFAFNTLMAGDLSESHKLFSALNPSNETEGFMKERLDRIFRRIDAVKGITALDKTDYRGWHFVMTGGLLLHVPKEHAGAGGRYDYIEDSESLCHEGIYRYCAIMDAWKIPTPLILAFSNPESHRLGLAFSEILGVKLKQILIPEEPGLFVTYDMAGIIPTVRKELAVVRPGTLLFSHASGNVSEQQVTADFTTFFYSRNISPWNRHTIFPSRPDLPKTGPVEPDELLAERITKSPIDQSSLQDLPQLLKLAEAGKELAASMQTNGTREKQWIAGV